MSTFTSGRREGRGLAALAETGKGLKQAEDIEVHRVLRRELELPDVERDETPI
ncbi:MAG: hypothetical protein M5U18_08360 [Dehalococcoidia bacterium]|nr:hypothetical protein [Dehalococcoidia bacterium]